MSPVSSLAQRLLHRSGTMSFDGNLEEGRAADQARMDDVVEAVLAGPGGRVLDVGCWTSWMGPHFTQHPAITYTGADISEAVEALAAAQRRVPAGSFVAIESVKALPFPDGVFDSVTFMEVIEHIPKGGEPAAFQEIARVLKRNGRVVLSTPLSNLLSPLDPAWYFGHRHYSAATLTAMAATSGLSTRDVQYFGGVWTSTDMLLMYFYKHVLRRHYAGWRVLDARATKQAGLGRHPRFATGLWCVFVKE